MKNLTITLCLVVLSLAFATNVFANRKVSDALIAAAQKGDLAEVKQLIAQGQSPTMQNGNKRSFQGTALHWAVEKGHIDIVKHFLSMGVDVNTKDGFNMTPLMWVANNPNGEEMIKLLLEKGADVNAIADPYGTTALMRAADAKAGSDQWPEKSKANPNNVRLLLEKGADINKLYEDGKTAADFSIEHNAKTKSQVTSMLQAAYDKCTKRCKGTHTAMGRLRCSQKCGPAHSYYRHPNALNGCSSHTPTGDGAHSAPSSRSAQGARHAQ